MSLLNDLLPKILDISKVFTKNFNDDLEAAFKYFDKLEEEFNYDNIRARDAQKDKSALTILPSINEIEDETVKSNNRPQSYDRSSTESTESRSSKKRSKHEVDGIESPEVDKRQKRNASVKAQNITCKQVNMNLKQKMRREASIEKSAKGCHKKDEEKENVEPPAIQIKEEKLSLPAEPMDFQSLPMKIEPVDKIEMPPPAAPVPKPRKGQKEKEPEPSEEKGSRRRTTRARKQTDTLPAASDRSTRASSRAAKQNEEETPQPELRPKRTRAKKVVETSTTDSGKQQAPVESFTGSPAEKQRPKRTRKAQKAAEKEPEKEIEDAQEEIQEQSKKQIESTETPFKLISPNKEHITQTGIKVSMESPFLQNSSKTNNEVKNNDEVMTQVNDDKVSSENTKTVEVDVIMDKTVIISVENTNIDTTVDLPNGIYNDVPVTPKNVRQMNETVILDKCNETVVLDNPRTNVIMDATVVIETNTDQRVSKLTDDNSLLTDDSDIIYRTPPKQPPPAQQSTSAVKEKVQQFEEMASRMTRTKTRAMAKKEDPAETETPPDKISKTILSSETLTKMNNMIFNGQISQVSNSANKPRVNTTKTIIPNMVILNGVRGKEDEKMVKEDARRKKEALLEAKRDMQKRKREDKMAAAAAAREAAERVRLDLLQAAERERRDKQALANLSRLERLKEVEKRKQELARKTAETEERRRAEAAARQQRLADERRRAEERQGAPSDADALKKDAALMAREMERRQKELVELQKMKQRMEEADKLLNSHKTINGHFSPVPPVYMSDGFQYLNSDEDEGPDIVPPTWCHSKNRRQHLCIASQIKKYHIDKLFAVREMTPDLQQIFPRIEKKHLKRTSSAVWRTPPRMHMLKGIASSQQQQADVAAQRLAVNATDQNTNHESLAAHSKHNGL